MRLCDDFRHAVYDAIEFDFLSYQKQLDWVQIRNFSWLLFIHSKSNFPGIADDLVNSYHLLLCVINFVYLNVLCMPNARNLLNKKFPGLPQNVFGGELIVENETHQILHSLCERHQANRLAI